jgi:antitoxin VapB
MALNIKDPETERLVAELAERVGESKTAAVRNAVRHRLDELATREDVDRREARLQRFLEEEIWPLVPPDQLGKPLSKEEQEEILGFGPDGV